MTGCGQGPGQIKEDHGKHHKTQWEVLAQCTAVHGDSFEGFRQWCYTIRVYLDKYF